MKPTKTIETELLKGCRKNDRRSQKALYEKYYNYVMYLANMYARNEFEAKEILNDAFYKVFKNIKRFDLNLPFKTMATNHCCQHCHQSLS